MISQDWKLRVQYEQRKKAEHDAASRSQDEELAGLLDEGKRTALLMAIQDMCEVLGIQITEKRRELLDELDLDELESLRQKIRQERAWPASDGE